MKEIPIAAYSVMGKGKGNNQMAITLPAMWAREVGLKVSDEVIITRVAGESCIRVYPPGTFKLGGKRR